jgi:hypothetical protein
VYKLHYKIHSASKEINNKERVWKVSPTNRNKTSLAPRACECVSHWGRISRREFVNFNLGVALHLNTWRDARFALRSGARRGEKRKKRRV